VTLPPPAAEWVEAGCDGGSASGPVGGFRPRRYDAPLLTPTACRVGWTRGCTCTQAMPRAGRNRARFVAPLAAHLAASGRGPLPEIADGDAPRVDGRRGVTTPEWDFERRRCVSVSALFRGEAKDLERDTQLIQHRSRFLAELVPSAREAVEMSPK
jgi:hypothetical protein